MYELQASWGFFVYQKILREDNMMCSYCGNKLSATPVELYFEDNMVQLCDEECAIYYFQEQQQKGFQSWVKIR